MTNSISIATLVVGQIETNCYIVSEPQSSAAILIDPGAESERIVDFIVGNNLKLGAILLTHTHFDHITALPGVTEKIKRPVYVNNNELVETSGNNTASKLRSAAEIRGVGDGDIINVGGMRIEAYFTPGHTPGGMIYRLGDALFTGDTLFKDSMGRTDLGGDADAMMNSLRKIAALEGDFDIYPGHGESSRLSVERAHNYYMLYALGQLPAQTDLN